jgi:uncharacterized protein YecT (DUF1311 family)
VKLKSFLLLFLISSHLYAATDDVYSACLESAKTTLSITDCHIVELKSVERTLNDTLNNAYRESSWIENEIRQSQEAWVQYRDTHCSAIYSYYENGTMRLIAHPSCMVELTKQRQEEIYTNFVKSY